MENKMDFTLERYAQEYKNNPEFIAEKLSIKVVEELLECLKNKNLNQSWLAEKMGVSRAHISRILNAPPNMTLLTIAKMAVAFGVTPDICLNAESPLRYVIVPATAGAVATSELGQWGYYNFGPRFAAAGVSLAAEQTELVTRQRQTIRPLQPVTA